MDKGPYYKLQDVDFWNFAYRLKIVSKTSKILKIRRHSWGTPLIEILSRSRRENADAICGDDCADECLIECQENFLEQIYKYPRYRQQQLREYFNNKSAFD